MKIYNSLTKQKQTFVPISQGSVKMYVCGPTVYDYLHVGNARPLVVFDTLRKYLTYIGYNVTYVQNFTDVDDKIIKRAKENSVTMNEISTKYINEAIIDMNGLNIDNPTHSPKVTEEISEIIEMIDKLIRNGNAYVSNKSVYFSAPSYENYGNLKNINTQSAKTRLEQEEISKKHPQDFILWKPKKDDEPYFSSPWGNGRPGWHIECSAIIKKYLGNTIDIHAGGIDLLFPHHENEIAQSHCANHSALANYFMHNGFININDEKMAKSLGNFLTIRSAASQFGYDTLRLFLLSSHYRTTINYNSELMQATKMSLSRIKDCLININFSKEVCTIKDTTKEELDILNDITFKDDFKKAMEDDFNTSLAISIVFDYVKFANINLNKKFSNNFFTRIYNEIQTFCNILGINTNDNNEKTNNDLQQKIETLILARSQAKINKDYKLSDEIRDKLSLLGVTIEDTRNGVRWKFNE